MKLLNCERPSIVLRVTQHIPEIIQFIQKLIKNNQAYPSKSGSVYFRTQQYSIESFFNPQEAEIAETDDFSEKEHKFDFALWKARKEHSEPGWNSPWSFGRPGNFWFKYNNYS